MCTVAVPLNMSLLNTVCIQRQRTVRCLDTLSLSVQLPSPAAQYVSVDTKSTISCLLSLDDPKPPFIFQFNNKKHDPMTGVGMELSVHEGLQCELECRRVLRAGCVCRQWLQSLWAENKSIASVLLLSLSSTLKA